MRYGICRNLPKRTLSTEHTEPTLNRIEPKSFMSYIICIDMHAQSACRNRNDSCWKRYVHVNIDRKPLVKLKMDLEKLIELIRNEEMLYNYNDKHYHDAVKRENIWREIGEKLNYNVTACKKQWNALRDAFRRHQKKIKTTNGQAATTLKKWKFQEEMGFLLPFIHDRNKSLTKTTVVVKKKLQKKRKKGETSASATVMDYRLKNKEKDDVEALFHGLAQTVKKLPPYYRALAKAKVSSIVGKIELKSITSNTYMHLNKTICETQPYTSSNDFTTQLSPNQFSSNSNHTSTPMTSPSSESIDFCQTPASKTQQYDESS